MLSDMLACKDERGGRTCHDRPKKGILFSRWEAHGQSLGISRDKINLSFLLPFYSDLLPSDSPVVSPFPA